MAKKILNLSWLSILVNFSVFSYLCFLAYKTSNKNLIFLCLILDFVIAFLIDKFQYSKHGLKLALMLVLIVGIFCYQIPTIFNITD